MDEWILGWKMSEPPTEETAGAADFIGAEKYQTIGLAFLYLFLCIVCANCSKGQPNIQSLISEFSLWCRMPGEIVPLTVTEPFWNCINQH